mmetsp:Transcript_15427/g.33995  ORF Transcript_15427/g.33995 Transcript_15427/m.33995 type:complete len:299 (-) Transcript_15427:1505-2401(-)
MRLEPGNLHRCTDGAACRLQGLMEPLDIVLRPLLHCAPFGPCALKHEVVVQEAQDGDRGEVERLDGRATPQGRRHGSQVLVPELVREALLLQPLPHRDVPEGTRSEVLPGSALKAQDRKEALPVPGAEKRGPSRKWCHRRPLKISNRARTTGSNGQGHVRLHGCHAQLVEHSREEGVVGSVVDLKSDVNAPAVLHLHRVRMAATTLLTLTEGHVKALSEEVGGSVTSNAGSNHADPWPRAIRSSKLPVRRRGHCRPFTSTVGLRGSPWHRCGTIRGLSSRSSLASSACHIASLGRRLL